MTKKDKDKGKPEPPIVLRDVLAGKPELVVHKADLTVTARALAKLLAEKCDYLFVHGGKLVIVELGEDDAPPAMRPAGVNEIIIAAHKHCQPVHQKPNERHEVTLPDKVAELYLAMPEEWRLRPLRGITTAPILHDDGSIRWERGYDAVTSLLCACNLPALSLPDKPSLNDAKSALATLRRAFRTFAFADRKIVIEKMNADGETIDVEVVDLKQPPGRDESAHLHALLGGVARFSLPLAPGYRVVAPELSGSRVGKGKLAHAISIVAFGKKINAAALGERKEEFDKGLTDKLLSGEQSILFDNLNNQTLRSRLLCVVLGESDADLRRLGAGMETARPAFIAVTGNGLKLAEDIVPRFITSELDAKCEHPEQRRFAGDFLADIARQRPELLRAALIIWRWGRQTKPKSKGTPPLGGFELWTAWIRDPLVALGCQEPVAQIAKAKAADPKRLNTAEIFQTWWGHHSNNGIKSNDLHDDVKALIEPDLKKRSRQNITTRVGRLVGTRLAGFHLCSDEDDKKKGEKGLWTPTVYWLEKTDETPAAEARPDAADDPDDWQFHREGDDAARPAAAEASGEPGSVASVPAFLTTPVKDELRGFGCTEEYILHVLPADAHAFLAQRRKLAGVLSAWSTTIGPGQPRTVEQVFADAEMAGTNDGEVSDELKRALGP